MSKVFVGYVNGRKYNNKQDFDQAVSNAVNTGNDLNIVSYYQEVSDNKCSEKICDCDKKTSEPVRVEYRDLFPTLSFEISNEVLDKLKSIDEENRTELLTSIHKDVNGLENRRKNIIDNIEYLESRIEKLKKKRTECSDKLTNVDDNLDYLRRLQDNLIVLDGTPNDCKCNKKDINCCDEKKPIKKVDKPDSFLDDVMVKSEFANDFYDFMVKLGFM